MDFNTLLKKDFIILDGGMGTMLFNGGLKLGELPEIFAINNKEVVIDIHKQYINSGSDIIYTNSIGANRYKLKDTNYTVKEVVENAISNAKAACKNTDTLVAYEMGPIGRMLEPTGNLSFEEAYDMYKEQILAATEADLVVIETITDLLEAKAAILAVKQNSCLPVICTLTFEKNMRTFTGASIASTAITLESIGADAIGINCSLGPKEMYEMVKLYKSYTTLPLIIKPNAGLPDPNTGEFTITADEFVREMEPIARLGVKFLGGCCGTTPEFIKKLSDMIKNFDINEVEHIEAFNKDFTICSSVKTVKIDQPRVIGERINPTGKKLFKEALLNNDMAYILNQALEQVSAGADILDVNVGLPGIDEKEMMVKVIKELQGIVDTPLQIDSTKPDVIEAALFVYNGKPIVNSVNGEEQVLNEILPIIKKYGASVVALTLDENGIPEKAEERFKIAQKIVEKAAEFGIRKEDIIIDCLVLTASAKQDAVLETIKAVKMVKEKLGVKTVLGVSNISFGLPDRELINKTFLTMALNNGLDLPIINPNNEAMMDCIRAFKVLSNIDVNSLEYIDNFNKKKANIDPSQESNINQSNENMTLEYAIDKGLKADGGRITKELLKTTDSMVLVNEILIPALDKVGKLFEEGKIYLPQLILSAGVAQEAFKEIKEKMILNDTVLTSRGKVVLATVKGDIHDIGKNIVKVLLENYGFTVIDLGKDVDPMLVVNKAIEHKVKLVGLSALMTTTLSSMEETIKLIREHNVDCKVVVGGAVLTKDYAMQIDADFYAKDAKESVDIAKLVYES